MDALDYQPTWEDMRASEDHPTWEGVRVYSGLRRVAAVLAGVCLFVELPEDDYDRCMEDEHPFPRRARAETAIRRITGLPPWADLSRVPYVVVSPQLKTESARYQPVYGNVYLDHNVDERSFAFHPLVRAMLAEFGPNFRWEGTKRHALLVRLRRPGWSDPKDREGV